MARTPAKRKKRATKKNELPVVPLAIGGVLVVLLLIVLKLSGNSNYESQYEEDETTQEGSSEKDKLKNQMKLDTFKEQADMLVQEKENLSEALEDLIQLQEKMAKDYQTYQSAGLKDNYLKMVEFFNKKIDEIGESEFHRFQQQELKFQNQGKWEESRQSLAKFS